MAVDADPPILSLTLWPHRSLDPKAFRWIMIAMACALAVPLIPILGDKALWVVGAFVLLDLALFYGLMKLTYRSGRVRETVTLWPRLLRIERIEPNGEVKSWEANPHWVRIALIQTERIQDYLVLSASGRDIELGAFLTAEERRSLADTLKTSLAKAATDARDDPR